MKISRFIKYSPQTKWYHSLTNGLTVLTLFAVLFYISVQSYGQAFRFSILLEYKNLFLEGFSRTILLSIISLCGSIFLGILIALGQLSHIIFFRVFSKIFIEIIRGTPFLVQILVFFYIIANFFQLENRFVGGVVMLSMFSGAYVAEIFRSGIESIGKTQRETAISLAFTPFQTFVYIIFPQLIRQILPPLAGQLVSLVKDSSLLSIISIREFTLAAREVNTSTYSTLESYVPLAIGYLLLTFPISMLTKTLEKKFKYET